MSKSVGDTRRYNTLCKVLDSLCNEAPTTEKVYHPPAGDHEKITQARSRALLHLFLKARFGIVKFPEREKFITDGKFDGGIDAFFIDQKNKHIYVLQSKFRASAGNFVSNNMNAEDLIKMDVKKILKGEKKDELGNPYNERITKNLQRAIQKLPDAGSYTTQVVLLGNTKNFTPLQLKKLIEGYSAEQFPHHAIYERLLFPVINGTYFTDPNLTIEINLANLRGDTHLDYDVKANSLKSNIKLLFVPTREIGRIMHTYKNSILKFNPRSFLELKTNPVNKEIRKSLMDEDSNEFALFNNGITIISDQTSISSNTAKQGTAQVVLHNPQLVNGGQTAYTLSRIYADCVAQQDYTVFKGKEVLLRVITFVGSAKKKDENNRFELIGKISKASNSQTKIEESDRRSNDEIQIKLQRQFFDKYGLYYERKRGEFSDGLRDDYINDTMIINREKLIRVSLAGEYRINQARSNIGQFFDETALANLLETKHVEKYAYGYETLRLLEKQRREVPANPGDRYHTKKYGQGLRYGQYAIVAACVNIGIAKQKSEKEIVKAILSQWMKFEAWAEKLATNSQYKTGSSFDYVNYYKGSTINSDVKKYTFTV